MKPITFLLAAAITTSLLGACDTSSSSFDIERKTVNGLPTVVQTESSRSQARVEAVDYANRSIALQGSDGNTHIFKVQSAVRNFYQIKKGDTVKVDYASRLAASVRKTGEQPTTTVTDAVQLAELGQKPGIICTRNAQIEATVVSIDYATRNVRLKTTTGAELALTANKDLKNLENVHAGDQVVFDYREALSIQVE
jgi:hypothetical protein